MNPKVEIRPVRRSAVHGGHNGEWVVWCRTADCEYADTATRKTEAQSLQRKHARSHRGGTRG